MSAQQLKIDLDRVTADHVRLHEEIQLDKTVSRPGLPDGLFSNHLDKIWRALENGLGKCYIL
jgi:hypothetical protein